ncbi:MAG: glycosyltransferase family 39 protein [Bacteroidales bacterium]|nr:MAG: glycosyltransferase family 39 protein [Bacteroidales bacterium]
MKPVIKDLSSNILLLALILATAIFLRFFRLTEIPFTQDEYSAIFRTGSGSLRDLIEHGIKPDGHPAGIQMLLYFMIQILGLSGFFLKLPFLVSGVLAVWLSFMIGSKWFNHTTGLITASFMSVLQYTVYYSQVARPYASGLFFSLWMVWHWTAILFHPDRNLKKNLAGFILAGILCSYNHHFSLLFAVIVWITGLFLVKPVYFRKYIFTGILMIAAYLPHLPVTIHQLGMKGVEGWLSRPGASFIIDYLKYVFHFSPVFGGIALVLLATGLFIKRNVHPVAPFRIIAITWFMILLVTGYIYSLFVNAVLQYSVLIFAFPFLLMFLFSYLKDFSPLYKTFAVVVVLAAGIATLLLNRHHYEIFYNSGPDRILLETRERLQKYGIENTSVIFHADERVIRYILPPNERVKREDIWYVSDTTTFRSFRNYVRCSQAEYLIFAWTALPKLEMMNIISEYFPVQLEREDYFLSGFHLFTKRSGRKGVGDIKWEDRIGFEAGEEPKGFHPDKITGDRSFEGDYSYRIDAAEEFGPVYTVSLNDLDPGRNDYMSVGVTILIDDKENDPVLVATVEGKGNGVEWRGLPVRQFLTDPDGWGKASVTFQFPGKMLRRKNMIFKTYIWNRDKTPVYIDNFEVKLYRGNNRLYGLFEEI